MKLIRVVQNLGWRLERSSHNHFKAFPPFPSTQVVVLSSSACYGRALMNARADLRRAYRVAGLDIPHIPRL